MTGSASSESVPDAPPRGRIVITGAAGLVGQNLVPRLHAKGFTDIVGIDKHAANIAIFREVHPGVQIIEADLAQDNGWQHALDGAETLISCHAQIGGLDPGVFIANNITATERLLAAAAQAAIPYHVQVSSSIVNSAATDDYTETKKEQERLALAAAIPTVILRPTLMFGWFDRKHLGWLGRFMQRTPVFPIPGHGRYLRQPLYAGDFCGIIAACLNRRITGDYNISGLEQIDYVDLVRALRETLELRTPIVKVPYPFFRMMLRAYAVVDRNPPFTVQQLDALATPDMFEVIDWPKIFGVTPTPLGQAFKEAFQDPRYSNVVLEF